MPIIYASIMPHGDEIVPELVNKFNDSTRELYSAAIKAADILFTKRPDLIIIASPHNLRLYKHIGIIATEYLSGELKSDYGIIRMRVKVDRDFAKKLFREAERSKIPSILVNYGTSEGELSSMYLDWGTLIPLWFVKRKYILEGEEIPRIVLVTPSREINWNLLFQFGEQIRKLSEDDDKKIALIASADQAHAHDKNGPYGYAEEAKEFDKLIVDMAKKADFSELLEIKTEMIERAKPDSFWQLLILHGVLKGLDMRNVLNVYQCPTYFGMLVSVFV